MALAEVFKILVWAPARVETPEAEAVRVYQALAALGAHEAFSPAFLVAGSKKKAKPFEATLDGVAQLIAKKRDKMFPDLGSAFGFFSSQDKEKESGITFDTGVSNPKFINTVVVDFSKNYPMNEPEAYEDVAGLFQKLVNIYEPFFAAVASHMNKDMYGEGGFYDRSTHLPRTAFWLNYWGGETARKLRLGELQSDLGREVYEISPLGDGCYVRLRERPFYADDEAGIALQRKVNKMLGL